MRSYRVLTGAAAAVAFAVCCAGQALAQAASPLPDDMANASMDWGLCRGKFVAARIKGSQAPEAIADDARKACQDQEARLRALAVQHFGASAPGIMDTALVTARSQAINQVAQGRTGAPLTDPSLAWGQCVGKSIRAGSAGSADQQTIVEQAMTACRDEERKTQAMIEGSMSHDQAAALMTQVRGMLHDQAVKLVAQFRQAR